MIAFLTVLLMTAASLGAGTAILRFATGLEDFPPLEHLVLGFALGVGLLGWLMFFPALGHRLDLPILLAIMAVCLLGWRWVMPAIRTLEPRIPDALGKALLAGILLALGFDFIEALAPPGTLTRWPIISPPQNRFSPQADSRLYIARGTGWCRCSNK